MVALVGPNGAGKSTLLNLAVGLTAPSEGGVTVLGGRPPGSIAALAGVAFVAQDTPLYENLSVADMLRLTCKLNRRFDEAAAAARRAELGIPLKRKAGRLSGGQQAQLALTLALARRPRLLVLDEPVAMLDPIASERRCWPASWRPAPSATPGRRASGGGAGRSPSWCCSRSWWPPQRELSAC